MDENFFERVIGTIPITSKVIDTENTIDLSKTISFPIISDTIMVKILLENIDTSISSSSNFAEDLKYVMNLFDGTIKGTTTSGAYEKYLKDENSSFEESIGTT